MIGCAGWHAGPAGAADPCRSASARGLSVVQPHGDGARTITRCAPDGSLIQSQELAVLQLDGRAVEKPLSVTRPTPTGGRVQVVYEYGTTADGGPAEAALARAAAVDDSCTNGEYRFNGSPPRVPWALRGYTYFANTAKMPHRDVDRQQITKGRHTWDKTYNGCGLNDVTLFSSRFGGATSATVHSYSDKRSVVDFGSLTPFTSDRTAIAISKLWWENGRMVEADTRFEQPPAVPAGVFSWSVSGKREVHKWDLWSMAAHESGHALGLGHATTSTENWLTMSPIQYQNSIRWQTLGRGDVLGLRALYP
jgi:hypothetical protein